MSKKPSLKVIGYEPVQILQNKKCTIPLLSSRKTAIRVFVKPHGLPDDVNVYGTLKITDSDGSVSEQKSISYVRLKEKNHPSLKLQRASINRALTFILGSEYSDCAKIEVQLKSLETLTGVKPKIDIIRHKSQSVKFEQGPTMHLRIVGLSTPNNEVTSTFRPKPQHFSAIRSYIERAFPISNLDYSEIQIDHTIPNFKLPFSNQDEDYSRKSNAPNYEWQHKHDIASAYVMALRTWEIENCGVDPRTHYYGLVASSAGEFFVGAASNVVAGARPDLISVGPAISDGSYGAHEIAHTLGGLHPGYPSDPLDEWNEPQSKEDKDFPCANKGRLSSPGDAAHGFDVGRSDDEAQVLKFDRWYDLMSWASPKIWTSDYRFKQIRKRLITEDKVLYSRPPQKKQVYIIGRYTLDDSRVELKNEILYTFLTRRKSLANSKQESKISIIGMDKTGKELFCVYGEEHDPAATDLAVKSGMFNVSADYDPALDTLQIQIDGKKVGSAVSYAQLLKESRETFSKVNSDIKTELTMSGSH